MEKQRFELLPGIHLTVLLTDKFKTNCLSLNLLRPLCREEAALNALLPDVLLRGCKLCPDMGAISDWLDERYGAGVQATARKKGEIQAIGFFMDYINERFAREDEHLTMDICDLLSSFLLEPVLENGSFVPDFVAGEKVNLINAIMAQINDKRTYASSRLRQEMFRGEAYGVSKYGEVSEVEAITPESLYAHYLKVLETSQIELVFTGVTDVDELREKLTAVLKNIPRGDLTSVHTRQGPMPSEVKEITEAMDVSQGKLVMGCRTGITSGDPEYPALLMMNGVFGGSLNSKLFMNVREKMSLCYYASSGIDRFKGVMLISSGVDTANYQIAKDEILNQLEACRQGDINEEELESTRKYLISVFKSNEDSVYAMDDYYFSQQIFGLHETPADLAEALKTVTTEEIASVAQKIRLDTIYFLKGAEA